MAKALFGNKSNVNNKSNDDTDISVEVDVSRVIREFTPVDIVSTTEVKQELKQDTSTSTLLADAPITRESIEKTYCITQNCGFQICPYHALNIDPKVGTTHFKQFEGTVECIKFRKENFKKH